MKYPVRWDFGDNVGGVMMMQVQLRTNASTEAAEEDSWRLLDERELVDRRTVL